ncbi:protein Star isoform X2 [Papilio machaon]|uniref:protein Star isoform X2 n=1 Tax=Papilio machaon TaxID=76193 RepID=UPI001E6631C5|nr:protein Star isoform X2 [Papilio machaon]
MAEKKSPEETLPKHSKPSDTMEQAEGSDKNIPPKPLPDKVVPVPVVVPVVTPSPRLTIPAFTKTSPNELYRKLLPAVLFLLTFVTVMTVLLVYMDTVALGAQQFRLNMSRDYELAKIPQESPPLVAYVRQLHLAPRAAHVQPPNPEPTPRVQILDQILGPEERGTFVEFLPKGPRDNTTLFLEAVRGWDGVVVRAAARDYLALRGAARALHACLSPTNHPREVTYQESESSGSAFRSRVLCLPLYTVLLAAEAARAQLLLLAGDAALPALTHLPYHLPDLQLQVIEVFSTDASYRNKTSEFLATKNYTIAATFADSVMYSLSPPQQ